MGCLKCFFKTLIFFHHADKGTQKVASPLFQEIANKKDGGGGKKVLKFLILHCSSKGHVHKVGILGFSKILLRRPYLPFSGDGQQKSRGRWKESLEVSYFALLLLLVKRYTRSRNRSQYLISAFFRNGAPFHIFSKILRANLRNGAPFRQKAKIFFALKILRKIFFQKNQNFKTKF